MTKRIVSTIVLAGLILGSVDAFASRAREAVMGTGDISGAILNSSGSMYYDSIYNIFYNPAYVNDFKNWAIIEKRASGGAGNEGGFVSSFMNFNVGVFFNRTDAFKTAGNSPSLATYLNGTSTQATGAVRPIDLVFGGDMGVKWGVGFTYATNDSSAVGAKENNFTARAGVSVMDFDPFISWRFAGKREGSDGATPPKVLENKTSDATIGLRYHYGEWVPYAAYRFGKVEESGNVTATNNGDRAKNASYLVGVGRNVKLGEGARMTYSISYAKIKYSDLKAAGATVTNGESSHTVLPIDMALEGDLASWLTIRGGLNYRLRDRVSGQTAGTNVLSTQLGSQADTTTARVGATIHANKFDFDWAFGNGNTPATGVDNATFGFDSGTFSYASLSYKW